MSASVKKYIATKKVYKTVGNYLSYLLSLPQKQRLLASNGDRLASWYRLWPRSRRTPCPEQDRTKWVEVL